MTKPLGIHLDLGDTIHEVPIKPFHELTVADYLHITAPIPEGEEMHETVARVFRFPPLYAWAMKADQVEGLYEWFLQWHREGAERWAAMKRVTLKLEEWTDTHTGPWNHEDAKALLEAEGFHRGFIEIDGVRYMVPQKLEEESIFGQWASLKDLTHDHNGEEAELYAAIMAIFCMTEGERFPSQHRDEEDHEFTARFMGWIQDRRSLFMRATMVDAMGVCAFFLSSSSRFRGTMTANTLTCPPWMRHWTAQTPPPTDSVGAPRPS